MNIKQLTNFDVSSIASEDISITKDGETILYPYKKINLSTLGGKVIKLGYCCEIKGIGYPIFIIHENGIQSEITIGETGMYEFQPEIYQNVNESDEEKEAIIYCTEVWVPANIQFVLDYCTLDED